jgi:SAM-dependent methyltransferase
MVRVSAEARVGSGRPLERPEDPLADPVVWHDVECGPYSADQPLWRQLAEECGGTVLDLGCGTGRVALELAQAGWKVTGVDSDPALVAALGKRARDAGLRIRAETADVRALSLGRRFRLAVAPMQVFQLLGGREGQRAALRSAREHLDPGGRLALALADPLEGLPASEFLPPEPDSARADGWLFTSTPLAVRDETDAVVAIDRLRRAEAPDGRSFEALTTIRLDRLEPEAVERLGGKLGLRALERRQIAPTDTHVGSTVVLLEAT